MIRFTCPCGKSLSARDEYVGETTRCPDCGREFDHPQRRGGSSAPAPRDPADEGVRRSRHNRDDEEETTKPAQTSGMATASIILGILSLVLCSVFTGLPAIILGAMSLGTIGRSRGRITGKGLAITGIVTGAISCLLLPLIGIGLLIPAVQKVREAAARMQNANNLKQISIAMLTYQDAYNTLPPAALCQKNGKKLLSWRVAILPYIEQESLYRQFNLDEPWDGPNNSKLIALMPKTYALPGEQPMSGNTYYRVFVGNGAAFEWCKGFPLSQFKDGPSNTILVAEAATAVPWTKPDELEFNPNGPLPSLGGHFSGGAAVALADGAVRQIPKTISPQTLKAAITRSAGDVLGPDW